MALELVCHVLCLLKKQSVLNITAIFFALTMWTLTRHLFWLAIVLACVTFVQLADTGNDDGFHLIVLLVSAFGLLAHEFIVIQKDLLEYTHTHTQLFEDSSDCSSFCSTQVVIQSFEHFMFLLEFQYNALSWKHNLVPFDIFGLIIQNIKTSVGISYISRILK